MSTIANAVDRALADAGLSSYASQARPVVDRLVAREQDMSDQLVAFATQQGLDPASATAALREVGMSVREAPPATIASAVQANAGEGTDDADLSAVLGRINSTLEDLADFARQNGWRPTR